MSFSTRAAITPSATFFGALQYALLVAALCVSVSAAPAKAADAELEQARALLASGDAAGALGVIAHIESRLDLPAGELLTLLVTRALAHAALSDAVALSADARMLVSIAPTWQAAADAPEALRAAVDEARIEHLSPPQLDVDTYPAPGAVRIVIEVDDDPLGAVRGTRISWRVAGERDWHRSRASEVVVRGFAGAGVEYHIEALGPGGVAIARNGTEAAPQRTNVPTSDADTTGGLGTMTPSEGESTSTWLIATGVVVAAVVVVLALIVAGKSSDRTDLGVPIIEWP